MRNSDNSSAMQLQYEIEQFLYLEAELLDDHRLDEWVELMAPEVRYCMPLRRNVASRGETPEYSGRDELAFYDEDKASLELRIRRLKTGLAWAEDPPSRTRHLVSNVRVRPGEAEGTFEVKSAFLCYRNRSERSAEMLAGERDDRLRRRADGAGFAIIRRVIHLDQATLLAHNLSFFL